MYPTRFKPLNADDGQKLKRYYMETHATKAMIVFLKIMGFLGSALLTIFSGFFGLMAVAALVDSIIDPSVFSVIGCAGCAFAAWMLWSVRKDTLV